MNKLKFLKKNVENNIEDIHAQYVSDLNLKIRSFQNMHTARGTFNSGRYLEETKDLLVERINTVYDRIWQEIYSCLQERHILLKKEEIFKLINDYSKNSIDHAESVLLNQIRRAEPFSDGQQRKLSELNLCTTVAGDLQKKVNQYKKDLESIEKNMYSRQSRNIALWSFFVAFLALILSIVSFYR